MGKEGEVAWVTRRKEKVLGKEEGKVKRVRRSGNKKGDVGQVMVREEEEDAYVEKESLSGDGDDDMDQPIGELEWC
ncbi:hypothetical protein ACH5RR_026528 [Cinchona calisaya]|uniref:Uncharacterized protein n=1 Tax=Cinchona calisaya TaxID=153742 RepID=A0ABD2Z307_9GENT